MGCAKRQRQHNNAAGFIMKRWLLVLLLFCFSNQVVDAEQHKNAYATMMYVGTPRDYEFYIAIRVLFKSLALLNVEADLVVIASLDVPLRWIRAL